MSRLRGKLTYANVTATLALFLVLAGGSAFAARQVLPKNTVGTAQLKNGAVTGAKIKVGAVTGAKIQVASLGTVPNAGHASSADTATSAANAAALGGVPASRYLTNDSVLATGEIEVGGWGASAANGSIGTAVINFKPKLGREIPQANLAYLAFEATSANCPGPRQAAPGFLCVYTSFGNGMTFEGFRSAFSGTITPAGPESILVLFNSTSSSGTARGSWAYQEL
jgi:hypothetical protein